LAPVWCLAVAHGAIVAPDGKRRALEVILSANDVPGDLAELYGYVNRSLPDADLDGFVDALAARSLLRQTDNHGYQGAWSTLLVCRLISKSNLAGMLALLRWHDGHAAEN